MEKIQITIPGDTLPSWNTVMRANHWREQQKAADLWHSLVWAAAKKIVKKKLDYKVDIVVVCYFKGRTFDSDNICAKLAIDGLKISTLVDDTPQYVGSVTTVSRKDKLNPRTEITLLPSIW